MTSIILPDIGGPALYAEYLPRELARLGVQTSVLCLPKLPRFLRELTYITKLFILVLRHDVLYSLSASPTVTLPIVMFAKVFRKKFFLRPGGDLLWERDIERAHTDKSLAEYYKSGDYKRQKRLLKVFKYSLRSADKVVFPTVFLKKLYRDYFFLPEEKCEIVDYPFPEITQQQLRGVRKKEKQILYAGRLIRFKNVDRLIEAFVSISDKKGFRLKIVGNGPQKERLTLLVKSLNAQDVIIFKKTLSHNNLLEEIARSHAVVIPSIFEPGSFLAFECLKLKTPLIFTKEAGLYDAYANKLLFVDPKSVEDIREKIELLLDEDFYKKYLSAVSSLDTSRSWKDVAYDHIKIFESIQKKGVLFIGVTNYNLNESNPHLAKKFEGLSDNFRIYSIARGKPLYKYIWNSNFYLVRYRPIFLPAALLLGCYICVTKKVDTIVCQSPLTEGLIGVMLKFIFRKELIVEIHGDWREGPFLNKKRHFTPILRKIVPFIGAWSLGKASKIRTLTCISRDEIKYRFPGKQYFVFPTFTDLDVFLAEKDTSFQSYILTVAVLSPIKSIETLIDAFGRVRSEFPEFKLVIVGDGPSLENLKLKVKNEKLEDAVIFTGRLSLNEVKEAMKDCYVFVLPSLSEGFGRVLIEAMALSKPVVATNVGGIPEIVKDGVNGFLFEPKDIESLSRKLNMLLSDQKLACDMGAEGRIFVENNFSNEKYIKNFISIINS